MQRAGGGKFIQYYYYYYYLYIHTLSSPLLLLELGCLAFHIFRRLLEKRVNAVIVSGGAVFAEAGVVLL